MQVRLKFMSHHKMSLSFFFVFPERKALVQIFLCNIFCVLHQNQNFSSHKLNFFFGCWQIHTIIMKFKNYPSILFPHRQLTSTVIIGRLHWTNNGKFSIILHFFIGRRREKGEKIEHKRSLTNFTSASSEELQETKKLFFLSFTRQTKAPEKAQHER